MGIEKIGPNVVHSVSSPQPKNETHKVIARNQAVREDIYHHAKWSQATENARLKAESYRIADISKINKNGQLAPAPNTHFYERPYKSSVPRYMHDVGTSYDVFA